MREGGREGGGGRWVVRLLKYTKSICSSPSPSLSKPQLSPTPEPVSAYHFLDKVITK